MIYVATRSSSQGKKAGIVSALGIGTGSLLHITAAAIGLSAIIFYSSVTFEVIKWIGAGYLIYLGIRSIMTANTSEALNAQSVTRYDALSDIYKKGVLVNLLNPKVALFFMAFLPQFVNPASPYFVVNIILLGLIFDFGGTLVNIIVAHFFAHLGEWLNEKTMFHKIKSWFSGGIYILLGIGLAASKK